MLKYLSFCETVKPEEIYFDYNIENTENNKSKRPETIY